MSDSDWLEEYRLNVDLWKHDDVLRQSQNQTFLALTSALLVAAGLVIAASDRLAVQGGTAIAAAVFGITVANSWRQSQVRHNAYIRFHRQKLIALETSGRLATFTAQSEAFFEPWRPTMLAPGGPTFKLAAKERRTGSGAEARMPLLVSWLWTVAFAAGVVAIAVSC